MKLPGNIGQGIGLGIVLSFLFLSVIFSCTQDAYEKGEGTYSLMRADFVEAHTDGDTLISQVTTDDGVSLTLAKPIRSSWAKAADTLYRASLYYRQTADNKADVIVLSQVSVASILPKDSLKDGMKTDPVKLESIWISKSQRYLNLGIYLKTGQTDEENAVHHLAVVEDTLLQNVDNTRTLFLQLFHDQGGVPEYYSQRSYFSLPVTGLQADSICFTVQTYEGYVSKRFRLK